MNDPRLPRRLAAADPGWTHETDVVVVGSGIAGLSAALHARSAGHAVTVVTKLTVEDGSTRWAQGGIAAALDPGDSPREHEQDTLVAGVGLCDEAAVRVLVEEGPDRVRELIGLGASFDQDPAGGLSLTREGGHHRNRIVHAGGDATGAEVQRALEEAVARDPGITLVEHALVLDLLTGAEGRAAGITLHVLGEGTPDGVGAVLARAVVLATGGMGQVFSATTNPAVSTGDGVALALRAGAVVTDVEFVQFHPTALWLGAGAHGQQPLVSEAVRGEGAVLVDAAGKPFMQGVHGLADLAPRDVVAKAILRVMQAEGLDHVWLDARPLGAELLQRRFPSIVARGRQAGVDPASEPIPVVPAAHYASGGVRTDLSGRTTVPGLYACGEVACTGVHGANRLASNSLLEGLVFAGRIGIDLARGLPPQTDPVPAGLETGLVDPAGRDELARRMSAGAGVIRTDASLHEAARALAAADRDGVEPRPEAWDATNLHTVSSALVAAAIRREETRGCHWREDFPDRDDARWHGHLLAGLGADGVLTETYQAAGVTSGTPSTGGPAGAGAATGVGPARGGATGVGPAGGGQTADGVTSGTAEGALVRAGLDPAYVTDVIARALAEDLAGGTDVTSAATVPAEQSAAGDLVARAAGVVAGLPVAAAVFAAVDPTVRVTLRAGDGDRVRRGDVLATVTGPTRSLLTAERTALNLLCHLSGVATATAAWVDAVAGTGARIRDTRKTTPGLRALEKYAVRQGGGVNHRMSLSDAALVKDNHVIAAGGVARAFALVRAAYPDLPVEVECDSVDDVREAVGAGADLILLDNMSPAEMTEAVAITRPAHTRTEASGGLTLDTAEAVAATGVDYISVGALTHSATVLDIALDLRES
jgi:nicotinate-nucleotide pyrophosphorylase (carboxylating)